MGQPSGRPCETIGHSSIGAENRTVTEFFRVRLQSRFRTEISSVNSWRLLTQDRIELDRTVGRKRKHEKSSIRSTNRNKLPRVKPHSVLLIADRSIVDLKLPSSASLERLQVWAFVCYSILGLWIYLVDKRFFNWRYSGISRITLTELWLALLHFNGYACGMRIIIFVSLNVVISG